MIKNTAGQKVGAQMVSATDGSAFTGSVTVAVTVDAGTQATGSVGSGACAHEGNGYHTYAPAQAETNGDLIAFTFTGTGAVPQTVQVYTRAATPDVNVAQVAGVTSPATKLAKSAAAMVRGTVDTGASTTSIPTSSLSPAAAVADQFKGRIVVFDEDTTTANLRGEASDITASTDAGVLTVTALTNAPASGDTFTIV